MGIDYQSELNAEQYKVVTEADGPALILAGAGSGKTRTVVYRVAYLIEKGVSPENILLLTFTNKAAKEMTGRVKNLLEKDAIGICGGTFHHFANLILRRYAPALGFGNNYTILDEEDGRELIKNCLKTINTKASSTKFPSPAILQEVWSYCRNAKKDFRNIFGARHPKFYSLAGALEQIVELYEQKKKRANAMDFDDLLLNLLNLLKNNEDILQKLSKQFQYILVDEYQDTNYIQAEIVYYLASHYKNILVVGDDAQSIYSFRAAEVKNILDFPKIFPDAKIYKLETNYRSTQEILNVANEIILNNSSQFPKNLQPASPKPSEGGPVLPSCAKPFLIPALSAGSEAKFIAEEILRLRDEGVNSSDIAVLFRAAHQSERLEMELNKRGILYEFRGGIRFFERAHIKDAIAYLKVINNFRDEASWSRILNLQSGIGEETSAKIFENILKIIKFDDIFSLPESDFPSRAIFGWKTLLGILKKISGTGPREALNSLIGSDYSEYLIANYPNAEERIDDLKAMAEFAGQYKNLNDFLSEVSLQEYYSVRDAKENLDNADKVVLSTIHQAKGLEWNSVFVMGLNEKHFPHYRALYDTAGLEEERRLFYVATTRAKKNLYFSFSLSSGFGEFDFAEPSRFLSEIPRHLLEKLTLDDLPSQGKADAESDFETMTQLED